MNDDILSYTPPLLRTLEDHITAAISSVRTLRFGLLEDIVANDGEIDLQGLRKTACELHAQLIEIAAHTMVRDPETMRKLLQIPD